MCAAAIAGIGLSVIPGVGTAIGIGAAAGAAGLDLAAINSKTGVDFQPGDMLVHATNGEAGHDKDCISTMNFDLPCVALPLRERHMDVDPGWS